MRSFIATIGLASALFAADPARERKLQQAIDLLETKGDVGAALPLFQDAARSTDRAIAARALLHLAQAQERRGKEQARATYAQIAKDFADQRDVAEQARQRLAALGTGSQPTSTALTARRIWAGNDVDSEGMPTPDGRLLSFVHWDTGDIAVRDLITGSVKRLMLKNTYQDSVDYAEWPVLSPDQRHIAFAWYSSSANRYQLRIAPNQAGASARTLVDSPDFNYFIPAAWSADGKSLLATLWRKGRNTEIAWVSITDGAIRIVRVLESRDPLMVSLSPDGRFIAYDVQQKPESNDREIHVMAADGSNDAVLRDPSSSAYPVWTPDGANLVFRSNRGGSLGLWRVSVQNGRSSSAAQLLKPDVGSVFLKSISRSGTVFYFDEQTSMDVLAADLGPARGTAEARTARLSETFLGRNHNVTWSPDGKWIAYHSRRGQVRSGPGSMTVVFKSLETGEERSFTPQINLGFQSLPHWLPDSKRVLEIVPDAAGNNIIYVLDMTTGHLNKIAKPLATEVYRRYGMVLGPDGNTLYLPKQSGKQQSLIAYDLASGAERELHKPSEGVVFTRLAVSRDGRNLAIVLTAQENGRPSQYLCTLDVDGKNFRELFRPPAGSAMSGYWPAWSTDGRSVYVARSSDSSDSQLWRIPADGGKPEYTGVSAKAMRFLSVSPNGSKIAFTSGEALKSELWALENALPITAAAR